MQLLQACYLRPWEPQEEPGDAKLSFVERAAMVLAHNLLVRGVIFSGVAHAIAGSIAASERDSPLFALKLLSLGKPWPAYWITLGISALFLVWQVRRQHVVWLSASILHSSILLCAMTAWHRWRVYVPRLSAHGCSRSSVLCESTMQFVRASAGASVKFRRHAHLRASRCYAGERQSVRALAC